MMQRELLDIIKTIEVNKYILILLQKNWQSAIGKHKGENWKVHENSKLRSCPSKWVCYAILGRRF